MNQPPISKRLAWLLLFFSLVAVVVIIPYIYTEHAPSGATILNRRYSAEDAPSSLNGLLNGWKLNLSLNPHGGDKQSANFFDSTELWCRFDLSDEDYDVLESELLKHVKIPPARNITVESMSPLITFEPRSRAPEWWYVAGSGAVSQFRVRLYSEPEHTAGQEWLLIHESGGQYLYLHMQ